MHQMRISTQAKIVGNPKKDCENCKRAVENKYCAMKLSQFRRRIELYMREIINFINPVGKVNPRFGLAQSPGYTGRGIRHLGGADIRIHRQQVTAVGYVG
jgi:hypothetical protein